MAEPNPSVADYYIYQYMRTHEQRYQQMLQMAQWEAQQGYEARVAYQKHMSKEAIALQKYASSLEKDLTEYIDSKATDGTKDADRDLALMRMYLDVKKAKAAEVRAAQSRRIQIDKGVDAEFDIPRTQVDSIGTAKTNIRDRGRLRTSHDQFLNIVAEEMAGITVDNPGSGAAVSSAQTYLSAVKDAAVAAGVEDSYTAKEAEIKAAIINHWDTGSYVPKAVRAAPDSNLMLDIPAAKEAQRTKQKREAGVAPTGGLSKAERKITAAMQAGTDPGLTAEEMQSSTAEVLADPEIGTLVEVLSEDGNMDAADVGLFTRRIQIDSDGDGTPDSEIPLVYAKYLQVRGDPNIQNYDIPDYQKLIFDPTFLRKTGGISKAKEEYTTASIEAQKTPVPASWEEIRQRGRELYSPIRMQGSPQAGRQFTVEGTGGKDISINASDWDDMHKEFKQVLEANPVMAHDWGLIQNAYAISDNLTVPGSGAKKNDPKFLGYTLHQKWKGGQIKDMSQISMIINNLAGSDPNFRDDITEYFHAYNIQPSINQMKGINLTENNRKLQEELALGITQQQKSDAAAAPTEDFEGLTIEWSNQPYSKGMKKKLEKEKGDVVKIKYQGSEYFLAKDALLGLKDIKDADEFASQFNEVLVTRDPKLDPRYVEPKKETAKEVVPPQPPPKEEVVVQKKEEVKVEEPQPPVGADVPAYPFNPGQTFGPTGSWHYVLVGYDKAGNPEFHGHTKAGRYGKLVYSPTSTGKAKAGYDEAMGIYAADLKKLEK